MSWGERSCKWSGACEAPEGFCEVSACTVDCPWYKWDGKTKPDSVTQKKAIPKTNAKPTKLDLTREGRAAKPAGNPKNKRFCLNCRAWRSKKHVKKCKERKTK